MQKFGPLCYRFEDTSPYVITFSQREWIRTTKIPRFELDAYAVPPHVVEILLRLRTHVIRLGLSLARISARKSGFEPLIMRLTIAGITVMQLPNWSDIERTDTVIKHFTYLL